MKSANTPYINLNSNSLKFIFQSLHLKRNDKNNDNKYNSNKEALLTNKLSRAIIELN